MRSKKMNRNTLEAALFALRKELRPFLNHLLLTQYIKYDVYEWIFEMIEDAETIDALKHIDGMLISLVLHGEPNGHVH